MCQGFRLKTRGRYFLSPLLKPTHLVRDNLSLSRHQTHDIVLSISFVPTCVVFFGRVRLMGLFTTVLFFLPLLVGMWNPGRLDLAHRLFLLPRLRPFLTRVLSKIFVPLLRLLAFLSSIISGIPKLNQTIDHCCSRKTFHFSLRSRKHFSWCEHDTLLQVDFNTSK